MHVYINAQTHTDTHTDTHTLTYMCTDIHTNDYIDVMDESNRYISNHVHTYIYSQQHLLRNILQLLPSKSLGSKYMLLS